MPTISLRLTEEELEALRVWAHENHRSIQREIIYRLFSERVEKEIEKIADQLRQPPEPDDHFKPDFGKKL